MIIFFIIIFYILYLIHVPINNKQMLMTLYVTYHLKAKNPNTLI